MPKPPVSLHSIAAFLQQKLCTDRYPASEQGGIYHASDRPVNRLGVALEPFGGLNVWVKKHQLDALWLHRPWRLPPDALPADVGILFHHLPFDEYFTIGYSPPIARALGLGNLEEIGFKQGTNADGSLLPARPIGMIGQPTETRSVEDWGRQIETIFGGYDSLTGDQHTTVERVAVVGAMNESLIREAAERGASLYITGQYRPSASETVQETRIAVIAVGHRRSEEWGLQSLADELRSLVNVVISSGPAQPATD